MNFPRLLEIAFNVCFSMSIVVCCNWHRRNATAYLRIFYQTLYICNLNLPVNLIKTYVGPFYLTSWRSIFFTALSLYCIYVTLKKLMKHYFCNFCLWRFHLILYCWVCDYILVFLSTNSLYGSKRVRCIENFIFHRFLGTNILKLACVHFLLKTKLDNLFLVVLKTTIKEC